MNAISDFLYRILASINGLVNNYGVSIIIFTFLMRMVCMPFDYKSRKGMRKMALIQPKINELQRKYGNDKQKLQMKQAELMKKEGYNPLSGCLPMLLTWPLMIAMFSAMRLIANEQLAMQVFRYLSGEETVVQVQDVFLWVKNIWMTDSPFVPIAPDAKSLQIITKEVWQKAYEMLQANPDMFESFKATLQNANISLDAINFADDAAMKETVNLLMTQLQNVEPYKEAVQTLPGWTFNFLLFKVTLYKDFNGLLILPILAGVTQVLQTKFMNPQAEQPASADGKGSGNFMKWFFPCLSVFFCLSSNAGFALYWVVSSVISSVQGIIINKILEKKDAAADKKVAGEGTVK